MSTVILQLLPALLLLTLSRPDTMVSPLVPPSWSVTDRSGQNGPQYGECGEREGRIMGAEMFEACVVVVVILAQPAGRDVDKHVASAEPQGSRAGPQQEGCSDSSQLIVQPERR